jgi:uncharacterized protein (TIGR03067 family)
VKRSWLVMLMVILPVAASARLAGAVEDKEEGLRGTWLPLSAELGKQKLPDATLKIMKLVLTDKTYAVHVADDVDKGTVKLDASKTPKAMDITGTEGPNKGKTMLAIYELKGDTLRICYDLQGKARPKEFTAMADQAPLFLVTYKRVNP